MGNDRAKTVIPGPSDEQTQSETKRFGERRRMCDTFRRSAENNMFTVSLGVPVPRIVAIRDTSLCLRFTDSGSIGSLVRLYEPSITDQQDNHFNHHQDHHHWCHSFPTSIPRKCCFAPFFPVAPPKEGMRGRDLFEHVTDWSDTGPNGLW